MLELTGSCMGGESAVEFFEDLADIIPENQKSVEFCEQYETALNRFRYEVSKGVGVQRKVAKAIYKGHKDMYKCGKCGSPVPEAVWKYCPNCGTAILR